MERIYGVFDNDLDGTLEALKTEKDTIEKSFHDSQDKLSDEEKWRIICRLHYNQGYREFKESLSFEANRITIFHFSGHHSQDKLELNDAKINDDAIIEILNNAFKLKIVFLNGCNTQDAIEKLTNVPVVIGTTKAIPDELAMEVSTQFYKLLTQDLENFSEEERITAIFEQAVDFQKLKDKSIKRGIGRKAFTKEELEEALNYYTIKINEDALDFDLRMKYYGDISKYHVARDYREKVFKWFRNLDSPITENLEGETFHSWFPKNFSQILEFLSYGDWNKSPIGSLAGEERYDKIKDLFFSTLCFLRYCGHSILWNYYNEKDSPFPDNIKEKVSAVLKSSWYLSINEEKLKGRVNHVLFIFDEIKKLSKEDNNKDLFKPYNQFLEECFRFLSSNNHKLLEFCQHFSVSKRDGTLSNFHIFKAEKYLYLFVDQCTFLTYYKMASVHGSQFFKYRVGGQQYKYEVKYFQKGPVAGWREPEEFTEQIYEVYSILLKDKRKKENEPAVLNLSPFYFDNNMGAPEANEIELMCFEYNKSMRSRNGEEKQSFLPVYCPSDQLGTPNQLSRTKANDYWKNIRIYYHLEQLLSRLK